MKFNFLVLLLISSVLSGFFLKESKNVQPSHKRIFIKRHAELRKAHAGNIQARHQRQGNNKAFKAARPHKLQQETRHQRQGKNKVHKFQQQTPQFYINDQLKNNHIVIFGMDWCKWCTKAAEVLEERKLEYKKINMNEIDVDHYDGFGDALHKDLKVLTGQQTVPVVYIDQKFVGGYDAMMEYLKNV